MVDVDRLQRDLESIVGPRRVSMRPVDLAGNTLHTWFGNGTLQSFGDNYIFGNGDGDPTACGPDLVSGSRCSQVARVAVRPLIRCVRRSPSDSRVHARNDSMLVRATVSTVINDRGKNGLVGEPTAAAPIRHWRPDRLVIDSIVHWRADRPSRRSQR